MELKENQIYIALKLFKKFSSLIISIFIIIYSIFIIYMIRNLCEALSILLFFNIKYIVNKNKKKLKYINLHILFFEKYLKTKNVIS